MTGKKKLYIKPSIESFELDRVLALSYLSPENDNNENLWGGTSSASQTKNRSLDNNGIADRGLLSGNRPKY